MGACSRRQVVALASPTSQQNGSSIPVLHLPIVEPLCATEVVSSHVGYFCRTLSAMAQRRDRRVAWPGRLMVVGSLAVLAFVVGVWTADRSGSYSAAQFTAFATVVGAVATMVIALFAIGVGFAERDR